MKRAENRQPSHSLPVTSTSHPEADTTNLFESSLKTGDDDNGQLKPEQPFHQFGEEGIRRNEGKQHIANNRRLKSGNNPVDSCTCDKINGYCAYSKIEINSRWFNVTNLTPIGNSGRCLKGPFTLKKRLVRSRLEDVMSKMRREPNAATEEALAKSRGTKAYMSWRVKKAKAKAAWAQEREEEDFEAREPASEDAKMDDSPSSPTSHHETPLVEGSAIPEDLTPTPEHNELRKKRKRKAYLENSPKRRKAALEPNPAEEDINTTEALIVAAHNGSNLQSEVLRGPRSNGVRTSPVVEIIRKTSSADSLQREDDFPMIPSSFTNPTRNFTSENDATVGVEEAMSDLREPMGPSMIAQLSVPMVGAIIDEVDAKEEVAELPQIESSLPKLATPSNSARRESAREMTDTIQPVPHDVIQGPARIEFGSHTTNPLNIHKSGGILNRAWELTVLNAEEQRHPESAVSPTSHARHSSPRREIHLVSNMTLRAGQPPQDQLTTPLTTGMAPTSLGFDSGDDLEIISEKIAEPNLVQARSDLISPSPQISLTFDPRQMPIVPPRAKPTSALPVKTLSQGRKKALPGLRELPGPTSRPGLAGMEIEAGPSTRKSTASGTPAKSVAQARSGEKKGPPSLITVPTTSKFTPTLVGRLLNTKPGPIFVNEELEEELTAPESSPGPGIARLEIQVGPKETKLIRQKPLPISISSDEDSDEDSPSKPHKHTASKPRLPNRHTIAVGAQTATAARLPASQQRRLQTFELSHEQKTPHAEIWPQESRGGLAQAAIDYLNAVPQNKRFPMAVTEMLNLLGEQPEFNRLCSQIKTSGRVLENPAFASAILSKLEPQVIDGPRSEMVHNRTGPYPRSNLPSPAQHSPNISRKMTPGRVVDNPSSSMSSRFSFNHKTKPGVSDEFPRSTTTRASPMSSEIISLMSPAPNSSQTSSLEHVHKRRKALEVASNRNVTPASATSEIIVLDSPSPNSSIKPRFYRTSAAHKQARENEVLDHIAERLLLHEGLHMLSSFIKFTTAKIVEEEYNLINAEKAAAKREAEKATNAKAVRRLDFSVYKRFADRVNRVDETPGQGMEPSFEWTWSDSQRPESRMKIRGRSTSVALPSEQAAQAPSQYEALHLTPRKIRGRSTTPELWVSPAPCRDQTAQDLDGKDMDSNVESTDSSATFFDANERLSTETL